MSPSPGALTLAVVVVAAIATFGAACKSKANADTLDAAARADAGADAATEGGLSTGEPDADAGLTADPAPTPLATRPLAPRELPFTPFTGDYRCFKGMHLEQAGTIVMSTVHTNATTDTVVACNVAGDVCTGTVREIQTIRGKSPKVMHIKPVTLQRSPTGDITYRTGNPDAKPGAHDTTFCARR
jgi:hypothetical protein